jgi:hypothetical protein
VLSIGCLLKGESVGAVRSAAAFGAVHRRSLFNDRIPGDG